MSKKKASEQFFEDMIDQQERGRRISKQVQIGIASCAGCLIIGVLIIIVAIAIGSNGFRK